MSVPDALSDQERQQAWERYERIRPCLDAGVPATLVAQHAGMSARSVERWVARYRRDGLAGLVRTPRTDRGHRRFPSDLIGLIEGLALRKPPPTATAVYRQIVTVADREGWPSPSYSTVYAVIRQLDPALVTLAHEGTKAYRLAFDLLHRREATGPNELWQADHTPLDLWVRDERGTPARPWLTIILDDYSRAVAAYRISLSAPTALNTALALRDAIGRKSDPRWHVCGIPQTFYTDHGSDFTSHHLEHVALDLKMELIFSEPGMPRGRGRIERFFNTINQLFLCTLPGYAPNGAQPGATLLTLPELEMRLRDFLLDDYHLRLHRETGMAPQARWEAGGFLPHLPESPERLDLLLLTVTKARKVRQDGIHFETMRYLDLTLAAYVGEWVTIRYDPQDMAEIRVYHEGHFLAGRRFADDPDLAEQSVDWQTMANTRPSSATGAAPAVRLPAEAHQGGPLPPTAQDYGMFAPGHVSPEALVAASGNRYSVPVLHVGAPVTIRLHRDRVRIWRDTTRIADHPRAPDGAHRRVIDPAHFAPLFAKKPRAQAMLYRDVLIALGGSAPAFLSALSRRHRARLTDELVAVYALYERHGEADLLAAMARAERARAYSADALAVVLVTPGAAAPPAPALFLPGVPTQAEVDRGLSVYEAWVQVEEALPEVAS